MAHVVALTSLGRKAGHYLLTSVSNCYLQFLLTFPHPVFKTQHFVTCFPLLPHTFTKISNGNLIVKYFDRILGAVGYKKGLGETTCKQFLVSMALV